MVPCSYLTMEFHLMVAMGNVSLNISHTVPPSHIRAAKGRRNITTNRNKSLGAAYGNFALLNYHCHH